MTSAHFAQHLFGQIGDLWPHACLKKEPLTNLSKWQRRIISSRMSDSINLPFKMEKWGGWGGGWCFTTWVERKDGQMSFHLFAKSTSCKQILWHPLTSLNIFLARLGTCDPMLVLKKEPLTDLSKWQRRIISSRMSDSINLPYPRQGLRQPSDQRQSLKHVGKVALATSGTGHWNLVLQGRCVADGYGYIPLWLYCICDEENLNQGNCTST